MEFSRRPLICYFHDYVAQTSLPTGFHSHFLLVGVVPMSLGTSVTLVESNRFLRRPCSVGFDVISGGGLIGI